MHSAPSPNVVSALAFLMNECVTKNLRPSFFSGAGIDRNTFVGAMCVLFDALKYAEDCSTPTAAFDRVRQFRYGAGYSMVQVSNYVALNVL